MLLYKLSKKHQTSTLSKRETNKWRRTPAWIYHHYFIFTY